MKSVFTKCTALCLAFALALGTISTASFAAGVPLKSESTSAAGIIGGRSEEAV